VVINDARIQLIIIYPVPTPMNLDKKEVDTNEHRKESPDLF